MNSYRKLLAAFFAACFITVSALAADASPTGTWKWTPPGRGGNPGTERTLVLEHKDGKVTGTLKAVSFGQFEIPDTAVTNGTFKDGKIEFTTENDFGGTKFVTKYTGKLEGDTITGTTLAPGRGGAEPTPREWVAKRSK